MTLVASGLTVFGNKIYILTLGIKFLPKPIHSSSAHSDTAAHLCHTGRLASLKAPQRTSKWIRCNLKSQEQPWCG